MSGEAAVDLILRRDPGNIQALVEKGDFRTRAGDERTAAAFYRSALREAAAAAPMDRLIASFPSSTSGVRSSPRESALQ